MHLWKFNGCGDLHGKHVKTSSWFDLHLVELLSIEKDNDLFDLGGGENSSTAVESDIFERYVFTTKYLVSVRSRVSSQDYGRRFINGALPAN